jgi:hypothetical protein
VAPNALLEAAGVAPEECLVLVHATNAANEMPRPSGGMPHSCHNLAFMQADYTTDLAT